MAISKEAAFYLVSKELDRAIEKHKTGMGDLRRAHSIVREEYVEFEQEVFVDRDAKAMIEVRHLAAMAIRTMMDLTPEVLQAGILEEIREQQLKSNQLS